MEEYISHEDYKKILGSFGKQAPKKALNEMHTMQKDDGPNEFHKLPADFDEGLEKEGNVFTAGLAKTKKGGEFEVGGKKFKDRTNYDASLEEDGEDSDPDAPRSNSFEDVIEWLDDSYPDANQYEDFKQAFAKELQHLSPEQRAEWITKFKHHFNDTVNEYQFDQMYPDDPGPFENSKKFASFSDDHGWFDDKDQRHKDFDFDYDEEEYNDLPSLHAKHGDTKWFAKGPEGEKFFNMYKDKYGGPLKVRIRKDDSVDGMIREFLMKEDDVNWDRMDDEEAAENETDNGIEEDINLPSSQPTGPSIEETRRPLSHLSPEERDQLRQYVETIKTVKEEINKMINKSGMKEGGNMTNLIMRPNTGNIRK